MRYEVRTTDRGDGMQPAIEIQGEAPEPECFDSVDEALDAVNDRIKWFAAQREEANRAFREADRQETHWIQVRAQLTPHL